MGIIMDGNNIFLIRQNEDGSFTNVPFSSAGIEINDNNLTFISENISFLSTGDSSTPSGPVSYIQGNPIVFSGQGLYDNGRDLRYPYITINDTDSQGNALFIQKKKFIGNGPTYRNIEDNYLINARDEDGIPVFAAKHFYTFALPGQSRFDKGRPYIGLFCNPDSALLGEGSNLPYSISISGHPTFGASVRFFSNPLTIGEDVYAWGKEIVYDDNSLKINTHNTEGYNTNFEIDADGFIYMSDLDGVFFSTEERKFFGANWYFDQNLNADTLNANQINVANSVYVDVDLTAEGTINAGEIIIDNNVNINNINASFQNINFYPPTGTIPSSDYPGNKGQMVFDATYIYYCKENNKWVRTALAEW
jgi:hypothetical protein